MSSDQVKQGADTLLGDEVYRSAAAAVSAVGSALGHVFFAPKANTPIAAFAAADMDGGFVNKHSNSTGRAWHEWDCNAIKAGCQERCVSYSRP